MASMAAARLWKRIPANPHVESLLTEAEIVAERIVAFGRCGFGVMSSLLFFTVVVPGEPEGDHADGEISQGKTRDEGRARAGSAAG